MIYNVMDMEFNYPVTRFRSTKNGIKLSAEIIEIGAVKLDENLNRIDTFQCYIKPTVYMKMNGEVRDLTEITTDTIWSGKDFAQAIPEFLEWCKATGSANSPTTDETSATDSETCFITWSPNDLIMLEDNMLYHGMDIDGLPPCFDIQEMFDEQLMGEGRPFPLHYAIWKLGIKPAPAHDALNDAINTAEVLKHLELSDLTEYEV